MTDRLCERAEPKGGVLALPQEVADDVIGDFNCIFRYGQGDPATHRAIIKGIAALYTETYDPPVQASIHSHLNGLHEQMAEIFRVPRAHTHDGEAASEAGIAAVRDSWWNTFSGQLSRLPGRMPPLSSDIVETVADGLVRRDLKYQIDPRPGRGESADVHGSLTRKHLVLQRKTGSVAVDTLFERAAPYVLEPNSPGLERSVRQLVARWEANHPGEKFFATEKDGLYDYNE